MHSRHPRLTLLGLLALGGLALGALLAAGDGPVAAPPLTDPHGWASWAAGRTPPEVAASLTRLVAMAMAGWLVVVVAAGCALRVAPLSRARRIVDWFTPVALRRLLEAAVGAGMSVSVVVPSLAAPAAAAVPGETAVLRRLDVPVTTVLAPAAAPAPAGTTPPAPAPAAEPGSLTPSTWLVRPGDDLWTIAEEVLASAWGRAPADAEVAPYWRALIEANRERLHVASDPDLVRPGQLFSVPPPPPPS